MTRSRLPLVRALAVSVLVTVYLAGAAVHAFVVNRDVSRFDQSAYLETAKQMRASGYDYAGDRNRMPVYPLLLSALARPGLGDERLFVEARILNIALSLLLLLALYVVVRRLLDPWPARLLVLIHAFTVSIYRAGYVQCELLYFFLVLSTFLLLWRLLVRPGLGMALAAGALAALSHLTKASILPGLVGFVVYFTSVHVVWPAWRAWATRRDGGGGQWRPVLGRLALVGVFAAMFLGLLSPYLISTKRTFGRYFYNVNTTFYIWADNWQEVVEGPRAHGDRVGWPEMPEDRLPGRSTYVRQHGATQLLERLGFGLAAVPGVAMVHGAYMKYVCLYALLLILALWRQRAGVWSTLREEGRWRVGAFLLLYFAGYYLLFAFYYGYAPTPRIAQSQLLPLMFSMLYALSREPLSRTAVSLAGHELRVGDLHRVVAALLLLDLVFELPQNLLTVCGGG